MMPKSEKLAERIYMLHFQCRKIKGNCSSDAPMIFNQYEAARS
uniref:Uncharacterized protein n=1 Tax=Rhizophora mucronata TaxID=61149 RepID=A0A2P2PY19_RHIMU